MNEEENKEAGEETKEVAEKSTKYMAYVIVFIVLLIAVFFSVRYFYNPKPEIETYVSPTGFEFTHLAGLWNTQWQRGDLIYNLHFHYNPGQTENISVIGEFDDVAFNKGYVYITFDPDEELLDHIYVTMFELSLNLNLPLNVEPKEACTKNATACEKAPIMNCTNTKEPVIQLNSKEPTFIELSKNCIFIQGKDEEIIRAADRLLFQWFGFM